MKFTQNQPSVKLWVNEERGKSHGYFAIYSTALEGDWSNDVTKMAQYAWQRYEEPAVGVCQVALGNKTRSRWGSHMTPVVPFSICSIIVFLRWLRKHCIQFVVSWTLYFGVLIEGPFHATRDFRISFRKVDMSAGQPNRIRATSAGYRFPEARPSSSWRSSPSLYHEKCTPLKERVKSAPLRSHAHRDYAKCDVVKQDEIWKKQCSNETKMTHKWWVVVRI